MSAYEMWLRSMVKRKGLAWTISTATRLEREEEERRRAHEEGVDPWGYDEPDGEVEVPREELGT